MEKVIVVVGPTGSGKTNFSIELAKKFNGEIISGDAYQCYREMNIGSAKIKEEEKDGITHYLVDFISYKEEYNVKVFQEEGRKAIQEIVEKGKVPIICGGTGLYIKALLYDYLFEEETVDKQYFELLNQKGNDELYEMLIDIDQGATVTIHKNNRKRVIRALMMAKSGISKSERLLSQQHEMLYDAYIVGLTMERDKLYERIDLRVLKMIEAGLENEVLGLVAKEEDFNLQSMRGIGYKEWLSYYNKTASLEETVAMIQKNSRNFAKRQYTWFKNQMNVNWVDVYRKEEKELALEYITQFLNDNDER